MRQNLQAWKVALPALGFLVLAALWSGFWYWSQIKAQTEVEQWRANLATNGIKIQCANETWGGYPFRVEVKCSPARIEKNNEAISLSKLTILAQIYNPRHILAVNDGDTTIHTAQGDMRLTHEGAIASLILSDQGHAQADVSFTNLAGPEFNAKNFEIHSRHQGNFMDVAFSIDGANFKNFDISANLVGAISPLPKGMRLSDFAMAASKLTVDQISLDLNGANFTGRGTMQFLPDGYPDARLKGRIRNMQSLIDKLSDERILKSDEAQGVNFMFGLLGANKQEGLPIDLLTRDKSLWLGPLKIGKLQRLF